MTFFRKLFGKNKREITISICGLENVGKTTILRYLETGKYIETQPTLGVEEGEGMSVANLDINIYDLGGQTEFRVLWPEVNRESNGIVYVVDKSDKENLLVSKKEFEKIIETQIEKEVVILVLLHKNDLEDGLERTELIDAFNLLNLEYKWACFETSVITGENIFESFKWLFDQFDLEEN